ncbi:amino acid synthesis family protein [Salinactinospora qingdaonensis]|uniref:Amino acid synthesis family protein n=1 Tax=Salinactinospora qingdaonensis TaxID=702744 RepID=A0ABP7FCC4_9ACTN
MNVTVRKIVEIVHETGRENGRPLQRPHRVAMVGAVIDTPYPAEYTEDLVTTADAIGAEIGELVGPRCVRALGEDVEAFGKAALVGTGGEVEHGSALIHNLRFGNVFRDAAAGTELLPAAEKIGPTGAAIDIPLKHKLDAKTRSHHQTVTFQVADAPLPREIVVVCAASNTGRPLARLASFGAEVAPAS